MTFNNLPITIVYKHSRFAYAQSRGGLTTTNGGEHASALRRAHEANLKSIDRCQKILTDLGLKYTVICRADLKPDQILDGLILSLGGDGTLLDVSHHVTTAHVLGVNSDPVSSVGALLSADMNNLKSIVENILVGQFLPVAINRMEISTADKSFKKSALNDLLICHKNPGATSRFVVNHKNISEEHRSSGIWVSTAAGSTGAAFSAGLNPADLHDQRLLFRIREPIWTSANKPKVAFGNISGGDELIIESTLLDQCAFVDGPHHAKDLGLYEKIYVKNAETPLSLFVSPDLLKRRDLLITTRKKSLSQIDLSFIDVLG